MRLSIRIKEAAEVNMANVIMLIKLQDGTILCRKEQEEMKMKSVKFHLSCYWSYLTPRFLEESHAQQGRFLWQCWQHATFSSTT